ncbi:MAG TPA: DUF456 family protein [Candidatus Polarisedimenticolaceae bacterium]|nr:DUF456 family protein [Candidatus Polarisedimenticolaceae bacterium]
MDWDLVGTVMLYGVGLALVAFGLVGLVLPVVPGAPLIFLGIVSVAWADGFERIGGWGIGICGALTLLTVMADYLAGAVGARKFGASRWGLAGALAGMVVGLFFGLPGLLVGPIAGAVALEYFNDPDFRRAGRVGLGTLIGFVLGTAVRYALAALTLGVALLLYLF